MKLKTNSDVPKMKASKLKKKSPKNIAKKKDRKMDTIKKKQKGLNISTEKRKKLENMSVDDMFAMMDEDSEGETVQPPSEIKQKKTAKAKKASKTAPKTKVAAKEASDGEESDLPEEMEGESDDSYEEDADVENMSKLSRKEYLEQLKKTDPEFYAAMMNSEDILGLDGDDDSDDANEDDDDDETPLNGTEKTSSAGDEEEDDDEESDSDAEFTKGGGGNITSEMIAEWEEELQGSSPLNAFLEVQDAFGAAIASLSGGKNEMSEAGKYKVRGTQSFNAIVRLCLRNMASAMRRIFQLKDGNDNPQKTKKWKKYRARIKPYLRHLTALVQAVAEPAIAETVIRNGILPIIPFYAGFKTLGRLLARRLVTMWATSDKKVRVLAFMAIFRLTQNVRGDFLDWILKKMYLHYVQNCRFTSPSTWGLIDFMRVSLVELYTLDYALAYQHCFVYVRQMAIHLRNAILTPKKDNVKLVYNWQYIHCLNLWFDLLGKSHPNPALQPMIYPVVQVAIGTVKLQQSPTFYPLMFHICKMLTELTRTTGTFIPVLPFLLEALGKVMAYKKPKKVSFRPFKWHCMLKLSRGELRESGFKEGAIDEIYDIMIGYLTVLSHSIAFPDLIIPVVWQIKLHLKACKNQNYTKKFRQLLDKIQENSKFIEARRKSVKFDVSDTKAVRDWEISIKQDNTPLTKYWSTWHKARLDKTYPKHSKKSEERSLLEVKKQELDEGGLGSSDEEDERELMNDDERIPVADDEMEKDDEEDDDGANDDDDDDDDDTDDPYGIGSDSDSDIEQPVKKKAKTEDTPKEIKDLTQEELDELKRLPKKKTSDVVKEFDFSDSDDSE